MNKIISAVAVAATLCLPSLASAAKIDFNGGLDPFFVYSSVSVNGNVVPASGYDNMTAFAGGLHAYNPSEAPVATFTKAGAGKFTLNSLLVDGAWGSQTLRFDGLSGGATVYSSFAAVTPSPLELVLNWANIDQLRVTVGNDFVHSVPNGWGRHWVIDNMMIDEVKVPEPAPLALIGLGVFGLLASRKKIAAKKAA